MWLPCHSSGSSSSSSSSSRTKLVTRNWHPRQTTHSPDPPEHHISGFGWAKKYFVCVVLNVPKCILYWIIIIWFVQPLFSISEKQVILYTVLQLQVFPMNSSSKISSSSASQQSDNCRFKFVWRNTLCN
jgi:hypothetical protein